MKIGDRYYVKKFTGSKSQLKEQYDTFQYIPLLSTLKRLLCDNSILDEIENCPNRIHSDNIIEDFCDGTLFHEHPLFSKDPYALQIIAYYDEVEMCNPLGSHIKKHKLGIVFFTLGNIHPKFRSSLCVINLLLVATIPVIERHGIDKILQPFITDLDVLATTGVTVPIKGSERTFKGALLVFLADNLASNFLGGFKLSFSFSFRCCRSCLVTNDKLSSSFFSDKFVRRSKEKHEDHCKALEGPLGNHYSKTYGINRRSCLMDVPYFSMLGGGLPHDVMHDILEGIAPLEIKLLLRYCIEKKFITLDEYNKRLINFSYGYTEYDKPIPILTRVLNGDGSLRSNAAQILLLSHILPFIIGRIIPEDDEHWRCFLLLLQIIDIVMCPVTSKSVSTSLKFLINEHHCLFMLLYNKEIPKLHFVVHYPEQMEAVGPMTKSWTMRHEAKLNFFKQVTRLDNFKNIASSMANRHQRWICYELSSGSLLSKPIECGPGVGPKQFCDETPGIQGGLSSLMEISPESSIFHPRWVRKDGIMYKDNIFLVTGSDGLDPVFAQLDELLVVGGDLIIFILHPCTTLFFDSPYHAYAVDVKPQRILKCISDLADPNVLHGRRVNEYTYVALKYYFMS